MAATAQLENRIGEGPASQLMHPFDIDESQVQNSKQVPSRLQASVSAIEALVREHDLPARPEAINKVTKQLPVLAALVDFWWQGVEADLEPMALSLAWHEWACELLLPLVYWHYQVDHTRCPRRRARMQEVLEALRLKFVPHAITQQLSPQVLKDWQGWATEQVKAFQRTSSAVEGRNGRLSGMHHTSGSFFQRPCFPARTLGTFLSSLKRYWPRWVNRPDLVGKHERLG